VSSVKDLQGCEGVEGSGLGAEAVVAEGDGLETELQAVVDFGGAEVAFGADKHEGVGAGGVELAEGEAVVAVAVAHQFAFGQGLGQEAGYGCGTVDEGQCGLERLFHGAEGYFVEAVEVEGGAFGVLADEGSDAVDANFDGFFDKPFEASVVFGGSHGYVEPVGPSAVVGCAFHYLHLAGGGVGVYHEGAAEGAVAGGDPQLVGGLQAKHADGVFGLVRREGGVGVFGVVGEE